MRIVRACPEAANEVLELMFLVSQIEASTTVDREYRVMWMLASGKQINAIAREMTLSPSTVSTYRTRILKKLRVKNNAELVHYAVRHQLVGDSGRSEGAQAH